MGVVSWIVFGLIAGAVARAIMPAPRGTGVLMTIILGIIGAFVGGAIGSALLGWDSVAGFDIRSFIMAIGGSVLVLWLHGKLGTRK
ncbi:MAG: GlsB/YeaQ/YmgE family stress response membrane protein [Bergeyella sp.]|nr:GlsB/YeaQ/YmgE family stress response membrane protein [Bergeyella sp.]